MRQSRIHSMKKMNSLLRMCDPNSHRDKIKLTQKIRILAECNFHRLLTSPMWTRIYLMHLKVAAVYLDKPVILDPVGASFANSDNDHYGREVVQLGNYRKWMQAEREFRALPGCGWKLVIRIWFLMTWSAALPPISRLHSACSSMLSIFQDLFCDHKPENLKSL